ncbi:MAG: hypothetical protein ABH867_02310 [Patescibacteria group bacterium]|nr:hypothetical protein [Patescibacteria group bacterium]
MSFSILEEKLKLPIPGKGSKTSISGHFKPVILICFVAAASTLLVWLPFWIEKRMDLVFANFDGPNYLAISKCWYNKTCIGKSFSLPQPLEYYPAHLPGYPLLISFFNRFLPGWWAMLVANSAAGSIAAALIYLLLEQLKIKGSFRLALIWLFLPARMIILRSIGAPETMFIGAIAASILFFRKKQYLLCGLFLAIAQIIKTPAVILFAAYCLTTLLTDKFKPKEWLKKWPLLLGPAAILATFFFYYRQTGDFFAYFHSGDNFHLFFPPFQSFLGSQSWLGGDFWLEDIVYVYLLGGLAVVYLVKKYKSDIIAVFPAIFYLSTLFVAHRDISRYSSPLYLFWLIAFAPVVRKKEFCWLLVIILPAIYLYAFNFIGHNTTPVADWTPYL